MRKDESQKRTAWIKLRVTPMEKETIVVKAQALGQTVTDFIRQRALEYRLRQTPLDKERVRHLARTGALLNQVAKWCNTYKSRAETLQVLGALLSVERMLKDCSGPIEGSGTPYPKAEPGSAPLSKEPS